MIIASLVLLSLKGDTRMSEKRRDKRNRILREGEVQRADGRYQFRYLDEDGNAKYAYSWRLDKNDPTPKGKKRELSLREKEKQIEANLFDNIVTHGGKYTVLEPVSYTHLDVYKRQPLLPIQRGKVISQERISG